ncbi:hypothetical protein [Myroides odoratimimus]|uniref:hypothetical protein n=1 Tax=Myroides odoratimimus TaxID=76832 RepID=UPI0025783AD5|nr:hypothetical protein [Myroides odoratimimus]MDM1093393.1 hypothetical protein [Myroides odoratimimus]
MLTINPYEYCDNQLGVKIKYLISDRNKADESLCLISYRAFKKRMDSDTSSEVQLRRGSLGVDALVEYNSLSMDWKEELNKYFGSPPEKIEEDYFKKHYFYDSKAYDYYLDYRFGEGQAEKLKIKFIEEYTYNASVLNTVLELYANRKGMKKALNSQTMDVWDSLNRDVNAFRDVPHTLPASRDGLRRKTMEYKKGGYLSLISKKLQNSNAKKVVEDEQLALLDELIAKHTNLENTVISTIYNAVADVKQWKTITAGTVGNRKKENALVSHAGRKGIKDMKNNILMQNKRSKPSKPMYYWTLDGWDVELYYQKTSVNAKGQSVTTYTNRLNAVIIIDPFNKYPVGYAIGTHETPTLIKQALQNAYIHVREMFGEFYKPFQIQSDNYGKKALRETYEKSCHIYTPAEVGNAKAKVIEPWFNSINKKYFKLFNNWSGHNIVSGSDNQPNQEYLNTIKKGFPDQAGCVAQIVQVLETIRIELRKEYLEAFEPNGYVLPVSNEYFLQVLGSTTGFTNRLLPEGVLPTINGQKMFYDSFDINFRKLSHVDWTIKYNPTDLTEVLAVNEEKGYSFMLEEKYMPSMALADQTEEDLIHLKRVRDFNKENVLYIESERGRSGELLQELFDSTPELQGTMAKTLLTDSLGQHKNYKSQERMDTAKQAAKINAKQERKEIKQEENNWNKQQSDYLKNKVNLQNYFEDYDE